MSWFKRVRNESKTSRKSSDASSHASEDLPPEGRGRKDTDPETCLEVFRNHWGQAYKIITSRNEASDVKFTTDEIETVSQNFEQMVTLLSEEEGEEGQGMPGPILHFLLEHEILEKFCGWCHQISDEAVKLTKEQLRMFEHLISHSHQLLLIHKPIIRPLLNLLAHCADDFNATEIETQLVLVLHQICISISKQTVILESFFNMNADHGPTKFLIFSLLIPFLHREGSVGQQARDALLLIMALSSKHPYIGQYIAENSDFCPVLATGLSGLYSDLPRKFEVPSEDWFRITDEDVAKMPEMNMFLNSLEFCNAVAQIAHPLVRDQLINFIYNGFLVPVLGPALHQNSREEVITTTAYLELFLRKITEPCLVKAFLLFILTEKNDEIVILDSLITRINSSSKLCLVSLSLFHTLVDLNCEDVMFQLVFKHLIPCTHVMVSQRRSLRNVDTYSKSAEKFLSLRPTCCLPELSESPVHGLDIPGLTPPLTNTGPRKNLPKFLRARKTKSKESELKHESAKTSFPPGSFGSKLEHFETSYLEYLNDAKTLLQSCALACDRWAYPYDGETPPPSSLDTDSPDDWKDQTVSSLESRDSYSDSSSQSKEAVPSLVSFQLESSPVDQGEATPASRNKGAADNGVSGQDESDSGVRCDINQCDTEVVEDEQQASAIKQQRPVREPALPEKRVQTDQPESMEDFLSMLDNSDCPIEKNFSLEESMQALEEVLDSVAMVKTSVSRTSTPRREVTPEGLASRDLQSFCDSQDISSVCVVDSSKQQVLSESDESDGKVTADGTTFEVIGMSRVGADKQTLGNATEFEILDSKLEEKGVKPESVQDGTTFVDISVADINSLPAKANGSHVTEESVEIKAKDEEEVISAISKKTNENGHQTALTEPSEDLCKEEDDAGSSPRERPHSIVRRRSSCKGDKSVRFAVTSMQTNTDGTVRQLSSSGLSSKLGLGPPSIGGFLTALLTKLDCMMQNSLPVNLMLTGLLARLAAYSQPLLRSFLLNHNLVFQPTVKSMVQVLTSVRQKVDHFSYTIQNFESLLLRARRTLAARDGLLPERGKSLTPSPEILHTKIRASTISELPSKEKRHRTLSQLLFRRPPPVEQKPPEVGKKTNTKLELIPGKGFRYINRRPEEKPDSQVESTKTRNAVYCALVLEEFVKELAALTQEHSVLHLHDENCGIVTS